MVETFLIPKLVRTSKLKTLPTFTCIISHTSQFSSHFTYNQRFHRLPAITNTYDTYEIKSFFGCHDEIVAWEMRSDERDMPKARLKWICIQFHTERENNGSRDQPRIFGF